MLCVYKFTFSFRNALSHKKTIKLADLKSHRFILREAGSGTRMAADQYFRKKKFKPNIRLELGSNEAVKESVAGGLGLGVISQHALQGMNRGNGVRVLEVEGFPLPSAWHMVHHTHQKLSPAALAFRKHVLSQIALKSK